MRRLFVVLAILVAGVPLAVSGPASAVVSFTARGSVQQVYTFGHAAGTTVELLGADDAVIDSGPADTAGAKLFEAVAPGSGYQVRVGATTVGGLTVTSPTNHPSDAWFTANATDNPLAAGFGYLTTRDGTDLSVNVTMPVDGSPGPWPVVVDYSGYDPSQPGGAPAEAAMYPFQGYVVVGVNMRGTGCSGGAFDFMQTLQSLDGYDMIETIAHQPWSNGNVGMVGVSYSGYSQLYVAATQPPHLDAITPLSPYSDTYSGILYPGGILNNGFAYEWARDREAGALPSAREWVRNRISNGDTRCEANQVMRLQAKSLLERIQNTPFADHDFDYLNTETLVPRIRVPTYLASQWQDEQTGGSAANLIPLFPQTTKVFASFTNGTHVEPVAPSELFEAMAFIDLYVGKRVPHVSSAVNAGAPGVLAAIFRAPDASAFSLPVNGWVLFSSYAKARAYYESRPRIRLRWENGSVPGKEGLPIAAATTRHTNWPVDGTINEKLYFQPDGAAGSVAPKVADSAARGASSYTYDPSTKRTHTNDSGTDSQWAPHPDVQWDPLREGNSLSFVTPAYGTPVAYAGEGSADLWLRSSAADTDLEVTLTEVRPDGQEVFIQSGWLRGSHRTEDPARSTELVPYQDHQADDASPLPAGQFTKVRVEIFPFAHVIRAGSRLRINVEAPGGNQPFWAFDALPGTATNEIGHSLNRRSRVVLPRLPASDAPSLPRALPACRLAGVTTQSVSLRNQPCRAYRPSRTPTAVAAYANFDDLVATWAPPTLGTPTGYRVVATIGAGAPLGSVAPAPVVVGGSARTATFPNQPEGVPFEVRVQALFGASAAPLSDATLPVRTGGVVLDLFGTWDQFVRSQLQDFTGQVRSDWVRNDVAALTAGLPFETYLAGLRHGSDARTNVDPISRLYLAYLQRVPTAAGMAYWLPKRRAGLSLAAISDGFAVTPEFIARYGTLSNRQFVERVFTNVVGAPASPAALAYWTTALDTKKVTRGQVMLTYSDGTVFKASSTGWVDVVNLYLAMLGRPPSAQEVSIATARLREGTTVATVAGELFRTPAYANRFR